MSRFPQPFEESSYPQRVKYCLLKSFIHRSHQERWRNTPGETQYLEGSRFCMQWLARTSSRHRPVETIAESTGWVVSGGGTRVMGKPRYHANHIATLDFEGITPCTSRNMPHESSSSQLRLVSQHGSSHWGKSKEISALRGKSKHAYKTLRNLGPGSSVRCFCWSLTPILSGSMHFR